MLSLYDYGIGTSGSYLNGVDSGLICILAIHQWHAYSELGLCFGKTGD
jgi:hypothetical protein